MHPLTRWSRRPPLDVTHPEGARLLPAALSGAALGLAWGVAARLWMRLISGSPEFSLHGTGVILGASAVVGTCVGLARALRHRDRSRRAWLPRALAVAGFGALCVGPGIGMVLSTLLATLGVVREGWRRALRIALLLPALAITGMVATVGFKTGSVARAVLGALIYPALLYPMLLGMRVGVEGREAPPTASAEPRP